METGFKRGLDMEQLFNRESGLSVQFFKNIIFDSSGDIKKTENRFIGKGKTLHIYETLKNGLSEVVVLDTGVEKENHPTYLAAELRVAEIFNGN